MVKYKHLWVWDTMMGSYRYYKDMMQEDAKLENAPLDAIYKNGKGEWVRASELGKDHGFWNEFRKYYPEFAWQQDYAQAR